MTTSKQSETGNEKKSTADEPVCDEDLGLILGEDGKIELDMSASPAYIVRYLHVAMYKLLREVLKPYGISPAQWYVLRVLWVEDGVSQRVISWRVGIREATAAHVLRFMEQQNLIRRERSEDDRRAMNIFLTQEAHDLKETLIPLIHQNNVKATYGVTREELKTFQAAAQKMIENMEHHVDDYLPLII